MKHYEVPQLLIRYCELFQFHVWIWTEMLVQCQSYLKMFIKTTNRQTNTQNVEDIASVSQNQLFFIHIVPKMVFKRGGVRDLRLWL